MANIFISYNREDEDKTRALVDDIEELGHTVWFDHELSGGQKWWDTILESVRNCDILVFALSVESLDSSACRLEYDYASKLGKTILPVLMGEGVSINLLPPVLSQIQFVDYRDPDRNALLRLAKALTSAPPSQPPPDPLPLPPEVPISYLGQLGKQIVDTAKLSYEEQSVLLVDLKRGLHDPETAMDTRILLKKLRKRQYLFENIAREIDELLESVAQETIVIPNKDETILSEIQKKPQNKTMSSNTPNSGNSGKLIIFVMVLLLIVGGAGYVYYLPGETQNKVKEEPKRTEEQKRQMQELERYREAEIERQKQEAEAERLRKEQEKSERLQQEQLNRERENSKELEKTKREFLELKRQQKEAEMLRQQNIERQKQEAKAERLRKEEVEIERLRQEKAQAQREELERLRQEERRIEAAIPRHTLTILPTPSNAKVQIKYIKDTYRNGIRLKQGSYSLKVSKKGYKNKEFTVNLNKDIRKSVTLKKIKKKRIEAAIPRHTLTILPTPSNARVQIKNIKDRYRNGIRLKRGSYTLKVSKKGYKSKEFTVNLNKDIRRSVKLKKIEIKIKKIKIKSSGVYHCTARSNRASGWVERVGLENAKSGAIKQCNLRRQTNSTCRITNCYKVK